MTTSTRSDYGIAQRRLREVTGYSVRKLAELAGLGVNALARYELAKKEQRRNPSAKSLDAIHAAFLRSPACGPWLTRDMLASADLVAIEDAIAQQIKGETTCSTSSRS